MKGNEKEHHRIIDKINKKLESNNDLRSDLEIAVKKIEEILGYSIDISITYGKNAEEYRDILETYFIEDDITSDKTMSLGEFINYLKDDERDLKLTIDPLNLTEGINEISNVVITTFEDDKIIIVPYKTKEK